MVAVSDSGFQKFLYAIKMQESGGNYSDVSAAGAIGAYQIMPGNVSPWASQAIGHPVTVDQFKNSPQLQDEIASFELLKFYNQYGARGAAAEWYAGNAQLQNDYTVDQWGQSPGKYADEVLARMQTAPALGDSAPQWATPGHWVGVNGHPINDPPTDIKYQADNGAPVLGDTKANAKKSWSDDTWNQVIAWLISYGGPSKQDGPSLTSLHSPLSDNDKGFVFDLYAHTVNTQPKGQDFNPSTGEVLPNGGPSNPFSAIVKLFNLIGSGGFWKRVGLGAVGAVLLIGLLAWSGKVHMPKAVPVPV